MTSTRQTESPGSQSQASATLPVAVATLNPSATAPAAKQAQIEQPDQYLLRDLVAQEDMAFWAMWMGIAALATFTITSVGTLLIWRQVRLTRQAVEAAVAGTEATREANAITREMGEAQARCYLSAKDAKFRIDSHAIPHVSMNVLNSGQSPARNFRWAFQVRLANLADGWTWENQPAEPGGGIDVPAPQQEALQLGQVDSQPMSQGQLSDLLLDPETRITISIAAGWTDVFGTESREIWRFQASGPCGVDADVAMFPDFPAVT